MSRFRLNPLFRYSLRLGFSRPSAFLRPRLADAAQALRRAPGDGWAALFALDLNEYDRAMFSRALAENRGFAVPTEAISPPTNYPILLEIRTSDDQLTLEIKNCEALCAVHCALSGEWQDIASGNAGKDIATDLIKLGVLIPSKGSVQRLTEPGLYRLQHASVLFRTGSTTVIVDPVSEPLLESWLDPLDLDDVGGVLISHSHRDHFSLLTLMHLPRHIPIILPRVQQSSMLCPDMASILRDAGFENVIASRWSSVHMIGDIQVRSLPFYGEQPWLKFPAPMESLRNAGNTYVVEANGIRSWLLVDSGIEYDNSMVAVGEQVRAELGVVDVVLGSMREFFWHPGQIDGSGRYLFCFPMKYLEWPETWPDGRLMTLGPSGLHELLVASEARHFAPYAHWWLPRQQEALIDNTYTEADLLRKVKGAGTRVPQLRTELHEWRVGDRIVSRSKGISVRPPST